MFDNSLFDSLGTSGSSGSSAASFYVVGIPSVMNVSVANPITVGFDQLLTTNTTVTLNDGSGTISIVVQAGSQFGVFSYIPSTTGTKTFTFTNSGQTGISDPTGSLTTNVVNFSVSPDIHYSIGQTTGRKFDGYTTQYINF